jgi:hypothetical protein
MLLYRVFCPKSSLRASAHSQTPIKTNLTLAGFSMEGLRHSFLLTIELHSI